MHTYNIALQKSHGQIDDESTTIATHLALIAQHNFRNGVAAEVGHDKPIREIIEHRVNCSTS